MTIGPIISNPIPAYQNVPIHADYFQPSRFFISNISLGVTTLVTTTTNHNFVVGQQVRLIIPYAFGCRQLNEVTGYVISTTEQTAGKINNQIAGTTPNVFPNPFTGNLFTAFSLPSNTQIIPGSFGGHVAAAFYAETTPPSGSLLRNGLPSASTIDYTTGDLFLSGPQSALTPVFVNFDYEIPLSLNQVEISIDSSRNVDPFIAANIPNQPQILAIGSVNSGQINTNGILNNSVYVPGSFINISPV